jgi:hypothetical protein
MEGNFKNKSDKVRLMVQDAASLKEYHKKILLILAQYPNRSEELGYELAASDEPGNQALLQALLLTRSKTDQINLGLYHAIYPLIVAKYRVVLRDILRKGIRDEQKIVLSEAGTLIRFFYIVPKGEVGSIVKLTHSDQVIIRKLKTQRAKSRPNIRPPKIIQQSIVPVNRAKSEKRNYYQEVDLSFLQTGGVVTLLKTSQEEEEVKILEKNVRFDAVRNTDVSQRFIKKQQMRHKFQTKNTSYQQPNTRDRKERHFPPPPPPPSGPIGSQMEEEIVGNDDDVTVDQQQANLAAAIAEALVPEMPAVYEDCLMNSFDDMDQLTLENFIFHAQRRGRQYPHPLRVVKYGPRYVITFSADWAPNTACGLLPLWVAIPKVVRDQLNGIITFADFQDYVWLRHMSLTLPEEEQALIDEFSSIDLESGDDCLMPTSVVHNFAKPIYINKAAYGYAFQGNIFHVGKYCLATPQGPGYYMSLPDGDHMRHLVLLAPNNGDNVLFRNPGHCPYENSATGLTPVRLIFRFIILIGLLAIIRYYWADICGWVRPRRDRFRIYCHKKLQPMIDLILTCYEYLSNLVVKSKALISKIKIRLRPYGRLELVDYWIRRKQIAPTERDKFMKPGFCGKLAMLETNEDLDWTVIDSKNGVRVNELDFSRTYLLDGVSYYLYLEKAQQPPVQKNEISVNTETLPAVRYEYHAFLIRSKLALADLNPTGLVGAFPTEVVEGLEELKRYQVYSESLCTITMVVANFLVQKAYISFPTYSVVETGPQHAKRFRADFHLGSFEQSSLKHLRASIMFHIISASYNPDKAFDSCQEVKAAKEPTAMTLEVFSLLPKTFAVLDVEWQTISGQIKPYLFTVYQDLTYYQYYVDRDIEKFLPEDVVATTANYSTIIDLVRSRIASATHLLVKGGIQDLAFVKPQIPVIELSDQRTPGADHYLSYLNASTDSLAHDYQVITHNGHEEIRMWLHKLGYGPIRVKNGVRYYDPPFKRRCWAAVHLYIKAERAVRNRLEANLVDDLELTLLLKKYLIVAEEYHLSATLPAYDAKYLVDEASNGISHICIEILPSYKACDPTELSKTTLFGMNVNNQVIGLQKRIPEILRMEGDAQRKLLGEVMYPMVEAHDHNLAPKITGMLIDLEVQEVIETMLDPHLLKERVTEATNLLYSLGSSEQETASAKPLLKSILSDKAKDHKVQKVHFSGLIGSGSGEQNPGSAKPLLKPILTSKPKGFKAESTHFPPVENWDEARILAEQEAFWSAKNVVAKPLLKQSAWQAHADDAVPRDRNVIYVPKPKASPEEEEKVLLSSAEMKTRSKYDKKDKKDQKRVDLVEPKTKDERKDGDVRYFAKSLTLPTVGYEQSDFILEMGEDFVFRVNPRDLIYCAPLSLGLHDLFVMRKNYMLKHLQSILAIFMTTKQWLATFSVPYNGQDSLATLSNKDKHTFIKNTVIKDVIDEYGLTNVLPWTLTYAANTFQKANKPADHFRIEIGPNKLDKHIDFVWKAAPKYTNSPPLDEQAFLIIEELKAIEGSDLVLSSVNPVDFAAYTYVSKTYQFSIPNLIGYMMKARIPHLFEGTHTSKFGEAAWKYENKRFIARELTHNVRMANLEVAQAREDVRLNRVANETELVERSQDEKPNKTRINADGSYFISTIFKMQREGTKIIQKQYPLMIQSDSFTHHCAYAYYRFVEDLFLTNLILLAGNDGATITLPERLARRAKSIAANSEHHVPKKDYEIRSPTLGGFDVSYQYGIIFVGGAYLFKLIDNEGSYTIVSGKVRLQLGSSGGFTDVEDVYFSFDSIPGQIILQQQVTSGVYWVVYDPTKAKHHLNAQEALRSLARKGQFKAIMSLLFNTRYDEYIESSFNDAVNDWLNSGVGSMKNVTKMLTADSAGYADGLADLTKFISATMNTSVDVSQVNGILRTNLLNREDIMVRERGFFGITTKRCTEVALSHLIAKLEDEALFESLIQQSGRLGGWSDFYERGAVHATILFLFIACEIICGYIMLMQLIFMIIGFFEYVGLSLWDQDMLSPIFYLFKSIYHLLALFITCCAGEMLLIKYLHHVIKTVRSIPNDMGSIGRAIMQGGLHGDGLFDSRLGGFVSRSEHKVLFKMGDVPVAPISRSRIRSMINLTAGRLQHAYKFMDIDGVVVHPTEAIEELSTKPVDTKLLYREDNKYRVHSYGDRLFNAKCACPDDLGAVSALINRHFNPPNQPDPLTVRSFVLFVEKLLDEHPISMYEAPLNVSDYIDEHVEPRKKNLYRKGYAYFKAHRRIRMQMSCFAKANERKPEERTASFSRKSKKERNIFDIMPEVKAVLGCISHNMMSYAKKHPLLGPSIVQAENTSDFVDRVNNHLHELGDLQVISFDSSSHDACISTELLEVDALIIRRLVPNICRHLGFDNVETEAVMAALLQKVVPFVRFQKVHRFKRFKAMTGRLLGTVVSGHPTRTTFGNTIRQVLMNFYIAYLLHIPALETRRFLQFYHAGDDSLCFSKKDLVARYTEILQQLMRPPGLRGGLGMVCKDLVVSDERVDFLSKYGYYNRLTHKIDLYRKAIRVIKTGLYFVKKEGVTNEAFERSVQGQFNSWVHSSYGYHRYFKALIKANNSQEYEYRPLYDVAEHQLDPYMKTVDPALAMLDAGVMDVIHY